LDGKNSISLPEEITLTMIIIRKILHAARISIAEPHVEV
jgi:hypothetical protein